MRKGLLVSVVLALAVFGFGYARYLPHAAGPTAARDAYSSRPGTSSSTVAGSSRGAANAAPMPRRNLFREASTLLPRANGGDAVALEQVASIYRYCSQYAFNPQAFANDVKVKKSVRSDLTQTFDALSTRMEQECGGFVGQDIGLRRSIAMTQQAAAQGNLAAQAQLLAAPLLSGKAPDSALAALAKQALATRDPEAMAALAPLMGQASAGRVDALDGLPVGTMLDEAAWNIAACRLGRDCGSQSRAVAEMCMYGGVNCSMRSVEDFYRLEMLPPADGARLGQLVNQLTQRTGP